MVTCLLEATYPDLSKESYKAILKTITKYVNFKFVALSDIDKEEMISYILDKAMEYFVKENINVRLITDSELHYRTLYVTKYAADWYFHYKIKDMEIPRVLGKNQMMNLKDNVSIKDIKLINSLYKRNIEGNYNLKNGITKDDRNSMEDILRRIQFIKNIDASKYVTDTSEADSPEETVADTSHKDVETQVIEKDYDELLQKAMAEMGLTDEQIDLYYLVAQYNTNFNALATDMLSNKKLLYSVFPKIKLTSQQNLYMKLNREFERISMTMKDNIQILEKYKLIQTF